MQRKKTSLLLILAGFTLAAAALVLMRPTQVEAQCGSQASSCKNCHEVQGKMAVNSDGTAWHTSHAFGDFCYICHAGNNQSMDQAQAHTGMVAPLSDIKASCQQCHPDDMQELAQVYATALGVEIGEGGADVPAAAPAEGTVESSAPAVISAPVQTELEVDDPNLVNYSKNYDEIVLGKKSVNWGNALLLGMIAVVMVGGGGYVLNREKLIKVSFGDVKAADPNYPAEAVEMLPAISNLKTASRKSLKKVLENPKKAEKILDLMEAVASEEKTED